MPPCIVKSQLVYSSNLFMIDDSPMMFYVYPSSDSNDIVQLIQGGGGLVVNDVDVNNRGAIYLSSNTKNLENRANCICTSFIYACCLTNKLLDINEFRLQLAPHCSSQSPYEHLHKGNALGEWTVRKGNFSWEYIRNTIQYIFKCESVWKTMADSKEFGDLKWRDIRNSFHLWAFLHLNTSAAKDSTFVRNDKCSCTKRTNESSRRIETKEKAFPAVCAERLTEENKDIEMEEDVTQTNLENRALETVTEDVEKTNGDHQPSCKIKVEGKTCNVASAEMLTEVKIGEVMRNNVTQSKLAIAVEGGKDISDDASAESAKLSYEMNNSIMELQGRTCTEAWEDLEDASTDEDVPQRLSENRVTMVMGCENVCSDLPEQSSNSSSEIMDKSSTRVCTEGVAEENLDEEMRKDVPITNLENRTLETATEGVKKISVDISKPSHNFGIKAWERSPILISVRDLESISTDDIVSQRKLENNVSAEVSSEKDKRVKSLTGGEVQREVNGEKKDKGTNVGRSLCGEWLTIKKTKCSSSTSSMQRPFSRDKNLQVTEVVEISDSDGSDTDEDINVFEENYAVSKRRKKKPAKLYTIQEDLKIVRWIITRRRRVGTLFGNRMWQFMEKKNVIPDRTWQSMKERFKRHIAPNIKNLPLSSEDRRKLRNELC